MKQKNKIEVREVEKGMFGLFDENQRVLLDSGKPLSIYYKALADAVAARLNQLEGKIIKDGRVQFLPGTMLVRYASLSPQELDESKALLVKHGRWLVALDPVNSLAAGPEQVDQRLALKPYFNFCEAKEIENPNWSQGPVEVDPRKDRLEAFLIQQDAKCGGSGNIDSWLAYVDTIYEEMKKLDSTRAHVVREMSAFHSEVVGGGCAVVQSLLLVTGRCTAAEYADGLLAAACLLPCFLSKGEIKQIQKLRGGLIEDVQDALLYIKFFAKGK